ncbi:T9SS type A sorting domain-containing protein [Adhaeribacter radiodurans]|uniref:T9SS type A sorting domain-containing protein n=1 Tax=Adhaeribacter radiodurans TaxID=2745197 RepID=A0A7L7L5W1_9BACT|nr:T9SS type A sorting domain-containing protein [Adhaeribacter radiodurans]QMU28207.1 T9SS type A sorting domain-containing protein [Adhaeribacter radiodurans]
MKNLFVAALLAITVSTTSSSFANSSPVIRTEHTKSDAAATVTLNQTKKSTLEVVIKNAPNPKLTVSLYDSFGNYLASRTLSNLESGVRLNFDLTPLEDGVYQVKVMDGISTQVKKFALNTVVPTTSAYQNLTLL